MRETEKWIDDEIGDGGGGGKGELRDVNNFFGVAPKGPESREPQVRTRIAFRRRWRLAKQAEIKARSENFASRGAG